MLNREIPFRPRLEGDFRIRFYNAVSRITENTTLADIENIADEEIKWVTSECTFNLNQRKKIQSSLVPLPGPYPCFVEGVL